MKRLLAAAFLASSLIAAAVGSYELPKYYRMLGAKAYEFHAKSLAALDAAAK